MTADFVECLKAKDDEFLDSALKSFKEQARKLIVKIQEDDKMTLIAWREKNKEKIDLIIARRLVRLDILFEARVGETILEIRGDSIPLKLSQEDSRAEAIRRAINPAPLMEVMKNDIEDFETSSEENIKELITTMADQDRIFRIHSFSIDKEFRDGLSKIDPREVDKKISERDGLRANKIAIRTAKRDKASREIFKKSADINAKLLERVNIIGIDVYDEQALNGRSLEDYCFDD